MIPTVLSFDGFELHLDSGDLFHAGTVVKLQPLPARVLEILARRSGEVVRREEIQAEVWGEETFLDTDASLNFCIKQIRRALEDSASSPRYIETIPRRGYRFLVPAEIRPRSQPAAPREPESPAEPIAIPEPAGPAAPAPDLRRQRRFFGLAALAAVFALLALLAAMQRPGTLAPQVPEEAREHYRTALYLRHSDPAKAREELRQALLRAPRFAEAHAMLAWEESQSDRPPANLAELERTARRAVELDPDLSLAHLALGGVLLYDKLDWKNGEAEIRRALELDPDNAEAWHALARPLAARGEHEEAIASVEKARALAPEEMLVNADLAWFYYLGRQYDAAVRQARSALALKESRERAGPLTARDVSLFRWAWRTILYSSLQTGDRRAGLEAARALMTAYGAPAAAERLVRIEDYWRWERNRFLSIPQVGDVRDRAFASDAFASNAAAAGEVDLALDSLDIACQRKWPHLILVAAADPLFDRLHGHPRFERFLDCIGVPADAPSRRR